MSDWAFSDDAEDEDFQRVLWESLPESVRDKFQDQEQIDAYLRGVERKINEIGLQLEQVGLAVNATDSKVGLILHTSFNPDEESYQLEKQMRGLMWDDNKDATQRKIDELKIAALEGDSETLGLE